MKAAEWIDQVAEMLGGASDYAVAKHLNITRATISKYRSERGHMDAEVCIKVAQALGVPELRVIADQEEERAKTPAKRAWWHQIATAAVVILSVAVPGKKLDASTHYLASVERAEIYIMRTLRRLARWLLGAPYAVREPTNARAIAMAWNHR